MNRKILIYTDSRGQHTPRNAPVHDVFAVRLAQHPGVEADVVLCPMKWTTTVDFLNFLSENPPEQYDHIILHTGIVDWSPRPQPSAIHDLYDHQAPSNLENTSLNTRDYSRKVINNKKDSFDALFGEAAMREHLNRDFGVEYEGHPTVNMYGLDMARDKLLPRLKALDNLLFINSNRFVPGWEGDFARGRPNNIRITESYSELFRDVLGPEKVIDLLQWSPEDVQRFTCDNIHLTKSGSDFIYNELCNRLGLAGDDSYIAPLARVRQEVPGAAPIAPFGRPIEPPAAMSGEDRRTCLAKAGLGPDDKLATLVIGLRLEEGDEERKGNFLFVLSWIDRYYGDLFDVLVVEQDSASRIGQVAQHFASYVRHEFVYNPGTYNRGWGYNVAVAHFTKLPVVALMDTDVLTGSNFVDDILDCHGGVKAISPYANIYFTNAEEADHIERNFHFQHLDKLKHVTKPTTISGGVVIVRRDAYEQVAGFEQYTSYGGEDRALDVTIMNMFGPGHVRISPYTYVHLHHTAGKVDRTQLNQLLSHLRSHYGCEVDRTLSATDFIHKNCSHVSPTRVREAIAARRASYADLNLYRSGRPLSINGVIVRENPTNPPAQLLFPPDFTSLDSYEEKELYKAPEPDADRLASFYNKYKGQRCFIIGNGPSLNKHDLSLLEGEYVFGVNSFYYKTRETGFRPTFYVVEDNAVMKENLEDIKAYQAPFKFFPTIYKSLHPEGDNVYFFKMNRGFYEKSSPNYCVPRFSTDAAKVLYCGQSVTYINLQLAFFMGFTEVYLIGMDFSYDIPKEHERRGDLIISTTDDPNHFHKDYFGKGKTWKDPKLERVAMNYRQAKISYEAVGRRIYNATVGGKLEIFDRVDYETLLRDPATGERRRQPIAPVVQQSTGEPATARQVMPTAAVSAVPPSARSASSAQSASSTDVKRAHRLPLPARLRTRYGDFALAVREKSPLLFRTGQVLSWNVRFFRRQKWLLLVLVVLVVAMMTAPLLIASLYPFWPVAWLSAIMLMVGVAGAVVVREAFKRVLLRQEAANASALRSLRSSLERRIAGLEVRVSGLGKKLDAQKQELRTHVGNAIHNSVGGLRRELSEKVADAFACTDNLQRSIVNLNRHLGELEATVAGAEARSAVALATTDSRIEAVERNSLSFDIVSTLRGIRSLLFGHNVLRQQETVEHGHTVLLAALADAERAAPGLLDGKTLIEVGTTRERILNQGSTEKLAIFTGLVGMGFITVDMDPDNTAHAQKILPYLNPMAKAVTAKGEDFLADYDGSIDFVYLDAFDFEHGKHSEHRREQYRKHLGTDISDEACWRMHEICAEILVKRMQPGGIVALDDTWTDEDGNYQGKGKLAMSLLLESGFEIIVRTPMAVALKRRSMAAAAVGGQGEAAAE